MSNLKKYISKILKEEKNNLKNELVVFLKQKGFEVDDAKSAFRLVKQMPQHKILAFPTENSIRVCFLSNKGFTVQDKNFYFPEKGRMEEIRNMFREINAFIKKFDL